MTELIAQGPESRQRWRRTMPEDREVIVGRQAGSWSVDWDERISRQHVKLVWEDNRLRVDRLPESTNPVFFRGRRVSRCFIREGEHFVIGRTTFTLADEEVQFSLDQPAPTNERTFSPGYLRQVQFRDAKQRIDVLARLPDLISGAGSDEELFARLVSVLLEGVPSANGAALVAVEVETDGLRVLRWDQRASGDDAFQPSEKLIRQAIDTGESVVHCWGNQSRGDAKFTQSENVDWAFCTPVTGEACRGWAIYLAGTRAATELSGQLDPASLEDEVKFTELTASTLSRLRELRVLERSQAALSQFLSPVVVEALAGRDPDVVLAPREVEVAVLFCDLRGFSRRSEGEADDLMGLLNRVSQALSLMTRHILSCGGVVGDFHGDSAMGFWGWPLSQPDAVQRACQAALGIRQSFAAAACQADNPLSGFRMGIGIATGTAVAGKLGSLDQVKVTVFGPVVNLASRLEGMTKHLKAPILIDETTASRIRQTVTDGSMRLRRVARVRPYGMLQAVEVSELLPSLEQYPELTDEHIRTYEDALEALYNADWEAAFEGLHHVPADDRVKDFLTVFIASHNREPPPNWDGIIPLSSK